jgi:hypothetical protein
MSVDIVIARRYLVSTINSFWARGYLAEWMGYDCLRDGRQPGLAGTDAEAYAQVRARVAVWPPAVHAGAWDLAALVRATKFFHDHVSKPLELIDHSALGCGPHPRTFDREEGRVEFRIVANDVLEQLDPPLQIAADGSVEAKLGVGLAEFLNERPTGTIAGRYVPRISAAVSKFQRSTTPADQKDAVRDLADLLELLRPEMATILTNQDEADLFNIANNFAIRHANARQRANYDNSVWMPWIFYWYLAAIHSVVNALDRRGQTNP